jgi:hypothetical protein
MHTVRAQHSSWQDVLRSPQRPTHIVQLCESDAVLVDGAAYFAAEGLDRGEAVILTGTQDHLRGIRRLLRSRGIHAEACERSGQLVLIDANDAAGVATVDELDRLRADMRWAGIRWWSETSNLSNKLGLPEAVRRDEEAGDELCRRYGLTLLCSFQCDRFDPGNYEGRLQDVCTRHTHVIPADDYALHRVAVNRAVADVLGKIEGLALQSLLSWKALRCELPSSQAVLFWLRDTMPEYLPAVLARVRAYHASTLRKAEVGG